ncbi:transposase [Candidatus Magnetomoraceae bacterium gMMP-1]
MEVYLYNDLMFKWLFGRQEYINPLKSLLNSVICYEGVESIFSDIKILNPFDLSKPDKEKMGILDLRVKDERKGFWIDVEIQVKYQSYYPERAMFYLAGMYRDQLSAKRPYQELKPCYGIHFLISDLFRDEKDKKNWYNHYRMLNVKNYKPLSKHWEMYFIELKKFQKTMKKENISLKSLEQWCNFLINPRNPSKPLEKHFQDNENIKEVHEMLQELIDDDMVRTQYRLHQDWLRDQISMEREKKEHEHKMREQKKAMQEKDKAMQAKDKAIKRSIFALKKTGQSDKDIAEIVGMSEDEVKKILKV